VLLEELAVGRDELAVSVTVGDDAWNTAEDTLDVKVGLANVPNDAHAFDEVRGLREFDSLKVSWLALY